MKRLALLITAAFVVFCWGQVRGSKLTLYPWQVPNLTRVFPFEYISTLYQRALNADLMTVDLDDQERTVYELLLDNTRKLKLHEQMIGAWLLERLATAQWMPPWEDSDARSEF